MGFQHVTDGDILSEVLEELLQQDSGDDDDGGQVTPIPDSTAMKTFDGYLQWLQRVERSQPV